MLTNPNAFRRTAAGVCLILAPVCLLLGMIIDPAPESGRSMGLAYAANSGRVGVSATLLHYCWVLLVPGVIGLVHLVRRRGVVLAHLGGAVAVIGLINFSAMMLADFFDIVLYRDLPAAQADQLMNDAAHPAMILAWHLPGLYGSLLGLVLVGIAVARAGVAGWWFPAGIVTGLAIWIYGAQTAVKPLSYGGPALLVAVFGTMGLLLLRLPDSEWSPAPPTPTT